MNLKKKWKGIFTSKFVGTGPSSYEKIIYRAAVPQRLRNADSGKAFAWALLAVLFSETLHAAEELNAFCGADFVSDICLSLVTCNRCATFSC